MKVYRSDPHFVLWYSRRENFVSYLISTQCWSLANQKQKFSITSNLAIIVFCKTFYFILIGSFFWSDMFLWAYFWKGHPIYWWWTLRETSPCNLKKYLGLVSFWPPLKGCFWIFQKQGHESFMNHRFFLFLTSLF